MFSRTVNSLYSSLPRGPPTVALLRALETCANRDPRDIAWQTVYSQALYKCVLWGLLKPRAVGRDPARINVGSLCDLFLQPILTDSTANFFLPTHTRI